MFNSHRNISIILSCCDVLLARDRECYFLARCVDVLRHFLRRSVQRCSDDVRRCGCFSSGKLPKWRSSKIFRRKSRCPWSLAHV